VKKENSKKKLEYRYYLMSARTVREKIQKKKAFFPLTQSTEALTFWPRSQLEHFAFGLVSDHIRSNNQVSALRIQENLLLLNFIFLFFRPCIFAPSIFATQVSLLERQEVSPNPL
jgi:hypothetical protein